MRRPALPSLLTLAALGCTDPQPAPADAASDLTDASADRADASGDRVDASGDRADVAPDGASQPPDGIPAAIAAHPVSSPAAPLMGVDGAVDVVYDRMGWPHIYASSLRDALTVQGYVMARDRMPQMEMLRRVASGTLAERFGVLSSGSSRRTSPPASSACAAPPRRCGPRPRRAARAPCSRPSPAA